ncbi:putative MYST-like histone acetyltransferase 1 isoform X2 [Elaeis guineensis]|uniref:putative MYST-like histone acetyltransferase 1 isoform X2 n=1 Tax=Elaeis guineensis var. tenera TaxID=51953 RepID=UPI00094F4CB1
MGTLRKCRWEDAEPHSVEIIESRRRRPANPRLRELHPLLRNLGRLDEWVKLEQLDLSSVDTDVYGEATRMRTQNQKRKMEEASTEVRKTEAASPFSIVGTPKRALSDLGQ